MLLLEDEIHLLRRPQCHTVLVSHKSWLGAPEGSLLRGIFPSKDTDRGSQREWGDESDRNISHSSWAAMTQTSVAMLPSNRKHLIFAFDTVTVQSSLCNYVLLILCYPSSLGEDLGFGSAIIDTGWCLQYGSYDFEWCRSRPDYALIKGIFYSVFYTI